MRRKNLTFGNPAISTFLVAPFSAIQLRGENRWCGQTSVGSGFECSSSSCSSRSRILFRRSGPRSTSWTIRFDVLSTSPFHRRTPRPLNPASKSYSTATPTPPLWARSSSWWNPFRRSTYSTSSRPWPARRVLLSRNSWHPSSVSRFVAANVFFINFFCKKRAVFKCNSYLFLESFEGMWFQTNLICGFPVILSPEAYQSMCTSIAIKLRRRNLLAADYFY